MNCKQTQNMMGAYLYGDLSPSEMRGVRLHVEKCSKCREDLASRGQVICSVPNTPPALSDEERQSIAWTVKGAIRHAELARDRRGFPWAPALAVGIVLVAVLAVGVLLLLDANQPPRGAQAKTPSRQETSPATVKITEDRQAPPRTGRQAASPTGSAIDSDDETIDGQRRPNVADRMTNIIRRGASLGATSRNRGNVDSHENATRQDEPVCIEPDAQTTESGTEGDKLPRPTDLNDAQTSKPDQPSDTRSDQ